MMEHEHGPNCEHFVVHHFCTGGKEHFGFVEEDGSLSCLVPLTSMKCEAQKCMKACTVVFQKLLHSKCQAQVVPTTSTTGGNPPEVIRCKQEAHSAMFQHHDHLDYFCKGSDNTYSIHHKVEKGHCSEHGLLLSDSKFDECTRPTCPPSSSCPNDCCVALGKYKSLHVELPKFCSSKWVKLLHPSSCQAANEGQKKTVESVLAVDGMCCSSEVVLLNNVLGRVNGVKEVKANTILKRVSVVHSEAVSCEKLTVLLNQKMLKASIVYDGWGQKESLEHIVQVTEDDVPKNRKNLQSQCLSRIPPWNITVALFCWLLSLLHYIKEPLFLEYFKFVALVSVALCAPEIALRSYRRVKDCSNVLDINSLMLLAVTGAIALGDYSEAAAVVSLFGVSGWLESTATRRVHDAMQDLFALKPEVAVLAVGSDPALGSPGDRLLVADIPIGTTLRIGDGDKVPLDGVVDIGETAVDESALTGEPHPVKKEKGDKVLAGTLNSGGNYIEIVTTALSEDTTVARMVRLIEEASQLKSPREQLVDRISSVYTPIIFLSAVLLASVPWAWGAQVGQSYTEVALVLLVVACPCAFVISTPITYVCGLAQAAKCGLLVKGGRHLESLGELKSLCLDKTGTLTLGVFQTLEVKFLSNAVDTKTIFEWLHCAESGSTHPLSVTLRNLAVEKYPELDYFTEYNLMNCETVAGEGISVLLSSARMQNGHDAHGAAHESDADVHSDNGHNHEADEKRIYVGNGAMARRLGWDVENPNLEALLTAAVNDGSTICVIGDEARAFALFTLGDKIREEAKAVVDTLGGMGISTSILTGDNEGAATIVGRSVGINDVHGNLLPEDKVRVLESMKRPVGMVGDGVNDALSIVKADVSIGMSNGNSKIAIDRADVALMRDDLELVLTAVKLGRTVLGKIKFNLTFSMLSKLVVVIITFTVFTSLWLAILVDVGAMLLVTLNSMSILSKKQTHSH